MSQEESIARIKKLKFGDVVTNICAGEKNPYRHCQFVKYKVTSRKNSYGIVHKSRYATCTTGNGKFGDFEIDVIYPGTLDEDECKRLWEPVWEAKYGRKIPKENKDGMAID